MLRFVSLIALAGCGRVGFEVASDGSTDTTATPDVVLGHDEDGDGLADTADWCPHVAGPNTDMDGDGVGDACDPNPAQAIDTIALFGSMRPGDQPFTLDPDRDGNNTWTQLADAVRFDGALPGPPDNNLYGSLRLPMVLADVRIALGIDILAVVAGSDSNQNQISLVILAPAPLYTVELNQDMPSFDVAAITLYDGMTFSQAAAQDLATGIHPGPITFQTTQRVGLGVKFEVAWPGEPYVIELMDAVYQGGTAIEMNLNNVHFEIRYVCVITST